MLYMRRNLGDGGAIGLQKGLITRDDITAFLGLGISESGKGAFEFLQHFVGVYHQTVRLDEPEGVLISGYASTDHKHKHEHKACYQLIFG